MGGVLAVVHEGNGVAVDVSVADGGFEGAVGVTTEDEVDAACACNEFYIIDEIVDLPAEVTEADDDVATLTST